MQAVFLSCIPMRITGMEYATRGMGGRDEKIENKKLSAFSGWITNIPEERSSLPAAQHPENPAQSTVSLSTILERDRIYGQKALAPSPASSALQHDRPIHSDEHHVHRAG
jgi:hypothetical protein